MPKLDPNEFRQHTKDLLAERASYICSKCKRHTSGGNTDPQKATLIGEAAHIEGAHDSDRRYNPNMTPEQRRDANNGIWLCGDCHKEVDDDSQKFTVEILHEMKKDHEDTVLHSASVGQGGRGGKASVFGKGTAIGGKGGPGGPFSKGGDGGDAHVDGEGFALGGEGGEAAQIDRGGKGGRGPLHVLMEDHPEKFKEISEAFGITEEMAKKYGKGGDGSAPKKK